MQGIEFFYQAQASLLNSPTPSRALHEKRSAGVPFDIAGSPPVRRQSRPPISPRPPSFRAFSAHFHATVGVTKKLRTAAETLSSTLSPSAALRRRSPAGEPLDFRPLWGCGRPRLAYALRGRFPASCRVITRKARLSLTARHCASAVVSLRFCRERGMSAAGSDCVSPIPDIVRHRGQRSPFESRCL